MESAEGGTGGVAVGVEGGHYGVSVGEEAGSRAGGVLFGIDVACFTSAIHSRDINS